MRKITILCTLLAFLIGTTACGNKNRKKTVMETEIMDVIESAIDGHTARNSLDYEGTYVGVLPCADCPGIRTELTLEKDTYKLTRTYLERPSGTYESSGRYTWNDAGFRITLEDEDPNIQFFVGENLLYQLDLEGERITGELAEYYKLEKVAE